VTPPIVDWSTLGHTRAYTRPMATKITKAHGAARAAKAPPAPKPTHRSVTRERAEELGKKRVTFYLDDWVPEAMERCAERAGDPSRNALVVRLLRVEAALRGVKVPPEEK
jgi:hypothetical protein